MAGIGDYIHFSNANYRKYGTTADGPSDYSEAIKIFEEQKNIVLKRINRSKSMTQINQLEHYLNSLLYGREIDETQLTNEEWSRFVNIFQTQFDEKFANFGVIFDNSNMLQAYAKKTIKADRNDLTRNRILQYIKMIENRLARIGQSGGASDEEIVQFNQAIEALNVLIQQVDDSTGLVNFAIIPESESLLNVVNKALTKLYFPTQLATGSALEYVLAAAGNYANERANLEADKIVDSMVSKVVGGDVSAAVISSQQFSKYVDVKELANLVSETWRLNDNTDLEMKMSTQDKVDVVLNWGGTTYNVSAKNYMLKDHKWITLVSGSPLLSFLNGENTDFINHWLNTVTMNSRERVANANLGLAHEAMKLTIIEKALTGAGTGKSGLVADTFIINNRSAKRIEVYSTHELLDQIEKNINEYVRIAGYPNVIKNVWVGKGAVGEIPSTASAQQRITHLIAQLSTIKLHASINYDKII